MVYTATMFIPENLPTLIPDNSKQRILSPQCGRVHLAGILQRSQQIRFQCRDTTRVGAKGGIESGRLVAPRSNAGAALSFVGSVIVVVVIIIRFCIFVSRIEIVYSVLHAWRLLFATLRGGSAIHRGAAICLP